jgi:hypothetical protein
MGKGHGFFSSSTDLQQVRRENRRTPGESPSEKKRASREGDEAVSVDPLRELATRPRAASAQDSRSRCLVGFDSCAGGVTRVEGVCLRP